MMCALTDSYSLSTMATSAHFVSNC